MRVPGAENGSVVPPRAANESLVVSYSLVSGAQRRFCGGAGGRPAEAGGTHWLSQDPTDGTLAAVAEVLLDPASMN